MGAATELVRRAFDYLLGGPAVGGMAEERLRRWFALPQPSLALPHAQARYVVVCAQSSEHDRRHAVASIAAIAVNATRVDFADCFSASWSQLTTVELKTAVLDFLDYLQKSPLAAFDAARSRTCVARSVKSNLGVPFRHAWIDVAGLLRAVFPTASCVSRGDWLERFGIEANVPDATLANAFATAQLLQIALDAATRAGRGNAQTLIEMQQERDSGGAREPSGI